MKRVRQTIGYRAPRLLLLALGIGQFFSPANADSILQTHRILDRGYGQALYEHFQQKHLNAITTLLVADQQPQPTRQKNESDLLLADLYYRYGLYAESARLFSRLLTDDIDKSLLIRVWFNLARLKHEQGDYDHALELLRQIDRPLPQPLQDEKQYLLSNLLVINDNIEAAKTAIQTMQPESIWYEYARYNLAVALLQNKQREEGLSLLEKISLLEYDTEEGRALRDQANLTKGLSLLKANRQEEALGSLQNVRLQGPLSHTALLATGWAWAALQQSGKSLLPWLELADKNTIDAPTQEALLAIPTTLEQDDKPRLAVQYYTLASDQFERQLDLLDQSIMAIKAGELISLMNQNALIYDNSAEFARSSLKTDSAPFLHILMSTTEFHSALKRYQELVEIRSTLNHWQVNLPTLSLMLSERQQRFINKKPLLEQTGSFDNLDRLNRARDQLASKLKTIESDEGTLELATEQENDHFQRLAKVAASLDRIGAHQDTQEQQDKHRLLNGLLIWQVNTEYAARLWKTRKQMSELDNQLTIASTGTDSLRRIGADNLGQFDQYQTRIDAQRNKVNGLISRVASLIDRQQAVINQLAIATIEEQKQHIIQLRLSARYSLARLYDKLVTE